MVRKPWILRSRSAAFSRTNVQPARQLTGSSVRATSSRRLHWYALSPLPLSRRRCRGLRWSLRGTVTVPIPTGRTLVGMLLPAEAAAVLAAIAHNAKSTSLRP
jgi:hypothetical protein